MFTKTLARVWTQTALIVWNTCIAFVCFNLALGGLYGAKSIYQYLSGSANRHANPVFEYYPAQASQLINLYPSMSKQEVADLLHETWSRPFIFESFVDFGERPFKGKYVNVSPYGYRLGRDQGPWPPRKDQHFVVFLFGGSTAFGYGVADNQTLGSALQEMLAKKLGRDVKVYNFGQGFFYSTQERILFEKLLSAGHAPDLAIFLDGVNDFFTAGRDLSFEPSLTDCAETSCVGDLVRDSVSALPMTRFARSIRRFLVPASAAAPKPEFVYNRRDVLESVIDRYLRNKLMIQGAAGTFASKVVFVWQPSPHYRYDVQYHLFRNSLGGTHQFSTYGYPLMKEAVDQHRADPIIWCADIQEGAREPLYIDGYHYSPKMIRTVSDCIVEGMKQYRPESRASRK